MKNCQSYHLKAVLFLVFTPFFACRAENVRINLNSISSFKSDLPESISIRVKDISFPLKKDQVTEWVVEEVFLEYDPKYFSEIEPEDSCRHRKIFTCFLDLPFEKKGHIRKKSSLYLNRSSIEKFTETLSQKTHKEPENAKLKMENGRISFFSLSEKGIDLDEEAAQKKIISYFENENWDNSLELPYLEKDPELSINSIDNMGITELIGEGRSNFRGSPRNRIFNIKVATKRFDGVLIRPKEEFSFVKTLGEVDGEHGYLPELVIKKDKTEPEFGGGICQVSTTAFRAAINAGLEITARKNHAYPVSYYNPQGMDATVYIPRPDLRFINDTPNYILIQPRIEGTELIFAFYGTRDGRKVEIDGPKVLEKNADGSMKTVFNQKVSNENGTVLREDVFKSNYDSPDKYPHPGSTSDILTEKPKSWSDNEWKQYKKAHNL